MYKVDNNFLWYRVLNENIHKITIHISRRVELGQWCIVTETDGEKYKNLYKCRFYYPINLMIKVFWKSIEELYELQY